MHHLDQDDIYFIMIFHHDKISLGNGDKISLGNGGQNKRSKTKKMEYGFGFYIR